MVIDGSSSGDSLKDVYKFISHHFLNRGSLQDGAKRNGFPAWDGMTAA